MFSAGRVGFSAGCCCDATRVVVVVGDLEVVM